MTMPNEDAKAKRAGTAHDDATVAHADAGIARLDEGQRHSDMTRIHTRIDELFSLAREQAVEFSKFTGTVTQQMADLLTAMARAEKDRADTCPMRERLTAVESRVRIMWSAGRWVGGVMAVALIIPGLSVFGRFLWGLFLASIGR